MLKVKKSKGFTLIELLVVIAIINIMASIVFINVNIAKNKAKDITIKADIDQLTIVGQMYYEEHNENYGGFCNDSRTETVYNAIPSPKKYKYCHHDSDEWAVCAQLNIPEDRSKAWCIDSTGAKEQIDQVNCVENITSCL